MTERRQFLASAGLGVAAFLGVPGLAGAADLTPGEQANLKIVADFCASWSTRDMSRILPFLSDDCVYRMTETTPPANGHDGVVQRLKQWLEESSLVEFAGAEGVGVFFVKDSKIKEWTDYTIRVQR